MKNKSRNFNSQYDYTYLSISIQKPINIFDILFIFLSYQGGFINMINYQLDYVVEEIKKSEPSDEQKRLKKLIGQDFTKEEAAFVWKK